MIKCLRTGKLATNTYLVICPQTNICAIIDPGGNHTKILETITTLGCQVTLIINTHGHADHIAANKALVAALNCKLAIHQADARMLTATDDIVAQYLGLTGEQPQADHLLKDGDELHIGAMTFQVIHTPGHTPGGISLYNADTKVLFSGDTLFKRSMGRYDLPGGNLQDLKRSLQKLCLLPEDVVVYPGHGPLTTIKNEREDNPYCQ